MRNFDEICSFPQDHGNTVDRRKKQNDGWFKSFKTMENFLNTNRMDGDFFKYIIRFYLNVIYLT